MYRRRGVLFYGGTPLERRRPCGSSGKSGRSQKRRWPSITIARAIRPTTYSGFVRYSSECLRCHGPDGLGSSYGPALTDSLKTSSYSDFLGIVASGKKTQDLVMPALSTDKNVTCYIDNIYVYLRARANDALGRGRPTKHDDKPEAAKNRENTCMGPL